MRIIDNENIVAFDIDDTIVLWDRLNPDAFIGEIPVKMHREHINEIKKFNARGQFVIVWSAGGVHWARRVIQQLELTKYVDLCMKKPSWAFDDKSVGDLSALCYKESLK